MNRSVRVGIAGTSWWADAMYLPPLFGWEGADVVACCGRDPERAQKFADRWAIPHALTDYDAMLDLDIEAVIIATGNETHYDLTMRALERGLHVLCEKPLGLTYAEASTMRDKALEKGVVTAVPFTYRHMPSTRYVKQLLDEGYLGRPYHLHMRYYAGFGRDGSSYNWRFDVDKAGSGALGDIGSHFLHLVEWFYGPITGVCAQLGFHVLRPATNPAGEPYEVGDDSAMLMLRFANGAQGVLHASTLAYEDTPFGQVHEMDLHGSGGTLRNVIDWQERQEVRGARAGEGYSQTLTIPDDIWGAARRSPVTDTYKDMFRVEGHMVREFVTAVAEGGRAATDFADGARVQLLLDLALESAQTGRWVDVPPQ